MKDKSTPFSIERKGYSRFEVEQCVKKLESEISRLERDNEALKSQLATVMLQKDEYEKKQALIEETLINAELTARDIILRAESKAGEAEEHYRDECEKIERFYAEKKQELDEIMKRVEYILKSQLALIEKE